jgi:hypothetical protein
VRILDAQKVESLEALVLTTHAGGGYRIVVRGRTELVCDESGDTHAAAAKYAIAAGDLDGRLVAWIGDGFCVGPKVFAIADCLQAVYELEPSFAEFCPAGIRFVPGDWRDTIGGKFDVIVYDLGGEVPRAELSKFLAPGGVILPAAEVPSGEAEPKATEAAD